MSIFCQVKSLTAATDQIEINSFLREIDLSVYLFFDLIKSVFYQYNLDGFVTFEIVLKVDWLRYFAHKKDSIIPWITDLYTFQGRISQWEIIIFISF